MWTFKDVKPGDVVGRYGDERYAISEIIPGTRLDGTPNGLLKLRLEGTGLFILGAPDQPICLHHCPRPGRK